jgi:mannosyltransferase
LELLSNYRQIVLLLLILIIAWLGRLYALDADSLWGDEIFSFHRASQPNLRRAWEIRETTNHPPMYELGVLYPWLKIGDNEFLLRFPSAFFGTLTVSIVYSLGKAVYNAKIGVFGALFLALSPQHLYYSREARMYALLACLITLELYCLYKAMCSPRSTDKYWVGYTFLATASLYTHYYAGFTLWAITGFVLVYLAIDWSPKLFTRWVGANAGIMLLFSPWMSILQVQLQNRPVPWIRPTSFRDLLHMPVYFFIRREVFLSDIWWVTSWLVWGVLASCLLYLFRRSNSARQKRGIALLISSVAGTFLIAFIFSARKPLIVDRYFTGILPATCLLVALGIFQLHFRYLALPLCAILLTTSSFSGYKIATSCWLEDWRAVTAYIEKKLRPGDTILLFFPEAPEFWRMPFDHYYNGKLPVACFEGEVSSVTNLDKLLGTLEPYERVWVIQSARFTQEAALNGELEDLFTTHRMLLKKRFDDQLLFQSRAVDVLCLQPLRDANGSQ